MVMIPMVLVVMLMLMMVLVMLMLILMVIEIRYLLSSLILTTTVQLLAALSSAVG